MIILLVALGQPPTETASGSIIDKVPYHPKIVSISIAILHFFPMRWEFLRHYTPYDFLFSL